MTLTPRSIRILLAVGLAAMILAMLDPMEGSIVIVAGIALMTMASHAAQSPHRVILSAGLLLAATGVAALWILSAMGGFGGTSGRPLWLGLLLLPYPIGWLVALVGGIREWKGRPGL
jgi:hypothetical protein